MNQPKAAEVVVVTDQPDEKYGLALPRTVYINGAEILLPEEARVSASIAKTDALKVEISFFASSVRFTSEVPE